MRRGWGGGGGYESVVKGAWGLVYHPDLQARDVRHRECSLGRAYSAVVGKNNPNMVCFEQFSRTRELFCGVCSGINVHRCFFG